MNVDENDINTNIRSLALCSELDITGNSIYLGIKRYSKKMNDDTDIFYFLYQTSIGIERLIKISHRLLAATDSNFGYKVGHKIDELHNKTTKYTNIELRDAEINFLKMITTFYDKSRYYNLDSKKDESSSPNTLLNTYLLDNNNPDIGFVIGNIVKKYYELIRDVSYKIGVFSYELNYDSNAAKVFYSSQINDGDLSMIFKNEQRAFRELVVAFINFNKIKLTDTGKYLANLKPVNMDIYTEIELIDTVKKIESGDIPQYLMDFINEEYDVMTIDERAKREESLSFFDANLAEELIDSRD